MRFYLNTKTDQNKNYEVHTSFCIFIPRSDERLDLGEHIDLSTALLVAKKFNTHIRPCSFCVSQTQIKK